MLKAYVKVHISVHLVQETEPPEPEVALRVRESLRYDLVAQHNGIRVVEDKAQGERFLASMQHHVDGTFRALSVSPWSGAHVPDLALAKGGCPEGQEPV